MQEIPKTRALLDRLHAGMSAQRAIMQAVEFEIAGPGEHIATSRVRQARLNHPVWQTANRKYWRLSRLAKMAYDADDHIQEKLTEQAMLVRFYEVKCPADRESYLLEVRKLARMLAHFVNHTCCGDADLATEIYSWNIRITLRAMEDM